MEQKEIANLIARAAGNKLLTEEERQNEGARAFKRRTLGFFGSKSVKTLDEMAQVLHAAGIASSAEEGRKITPQLMGGRISYGQIKELAFDEVTDGAGNTRYRISAYSLDCGD